MSKLRTSPRLIRNMMTSLVISGRIKTTKSKARDIKQALQKLSSRAKKIKNKTEQYRFVKRFLFGKAPDKLIDEIETYNHIKTYDLSERRGDGALEVIVEIEKQAKPKKKAKNG